MEITWYPQLNMDGVMELCRVGVIIYPNAGCLM